MIVPGVWVSRVGFGMTNTGSMLSALVAIASPVTGTADWYVTSDTDQVKPTLVRVAGLTGRTCPHLLNHTSIHFHKP
jgi:hypothetical protein